MFKRKNAQRIIAFALAYLVSFPAISYAITNLAAFWEIPIISSVATPILYISFYATLILAMLRTLKKTSLARLVVTTFMAVSFILTWFSERGNSRYMWTSWNDLLQNPTYTFWFFSFYAFVLSDHIRDSVLLAETLEKFSYVSIVLALMQYLTAKYQNTTPEYMTFSYNILFATAYLIILHFNQPNWRRLAAGVIGAGLILIAGCRGALVGLILSIVVFLFFDLKHASAKRVITIVVLFIASALIMLFWQDILDGIVIVCKSLGIESRTVELVASKSFFDDSGRLDIISVGLNNIGLFGQGLYSDRVLLRGDYLHNIFCEILLDYGIVLGTLIIVALLMVLFRGWASSDGPYKMVISALLSAGLVKLMFSSSFLQYEPAFFLLVGLCMNSTHIIKNKKWV